MDAELKAKWIEALRSGKFKQGRSQFQSGERFCCLGVLCKVAGKPTQVGTCGNWPFADASVGGAVISNALAKMNDSGETFAAIADHIEANIPAA